MWDVSNQTRINRPDRSTTNVVNIKLSIWVCWRTSGCVVLGSRSGCRTTDSYKGVSHFSPTICWTDAGTPLNVVLLAHFLTVSPNQIIIIIIISFHFLNVHLVNSVNTDFLWFNSEFSLIFILGIWSVRVWMIGCLLAEGWWWRGREVGAEVGRHGNSVLGMTWNCLVCILSGLFLGICGGTWFGANV